MKTFLCPHCQYKVYFESVSCVRCRQSFGFNATKMAMTTVRSVNAGSNAPALQHELCANAVHQVCNWVTSADNANRLCLACDLNRTIPNLSEAGGLDAWRDLERAKKRLIYSLLRFGLPLGNGPDDMNPLTFDFARNTITGHINGVITIDVIEADAVERERLRQHFGEPYRNLLGHLRHECGHFYWMSLVEQSSLLLPFRKLFGDERQDYQTALSGYHAGQPRSDWQAHYVSPYSSAHPWEDWAETWAHYLHMTDAVDTAEAEGMEPRAAGLSLGSIWPFKKYDVYRDQSFGSLMDRWIPLTIAMNSMSRSMGHADFYPFVITAAVYEKLAFVHKAIRSRKELAR